MDEKKKRPKTAVLAFMQGLANGENEQERAQKFNKTEIVKKTAPFAYKANISAETQLYDLPSGKKCRFIPKTIDAHKCMAWNGNARDHGKLDREALESLKVSIVAQGQLVPALARPSKDRQKENFTHEIIYGSRRLKACQELNQPIKVIEADLPDEDALFFMEAENAAREDLSLYEKAKIYHKWLEEKVFSSREELADKVGVSKRWVIKLLSLLQIPDFVIDALPNYKDLTKSRSEKLIICFSKYAEAHAKIKNEIEMLRSENENYSADKLFERILNAFPAKDGENSSLVSEAKEMITEEGEKVITVKTSKTGKVKIEINPYLSSKKLTKLLDNLEKIIKKL